MPYHRGMQHHLTGLGDVLKLRVAASSNLLANALKYSPANTTVTLRLRITGSSCHLEVVDQGPGIPLHEQTLIFNKYARGAAAQRTPGAGLGLALVKRIADLHGGSVRLESQPGAGARFMVDIPLRQPDPPEPE